MKSTFQLIYDNGLDNMKKIIDTFQDGFFYLKNYKAYDRMQYLDKKNIQALQLKKFQSIVKTAILNVPYYKSYGKIIDLNHITLDDLQKFPIIDKKTILDNAELFINHTQKHYENWQTSGSTGERFTFRVPKQARLIDKIIFLRTMSNQDVKIRAKSSLAGISSYSPAEGEPLFKNYGPFNNIWLLSPFHISDSTVHQYVDIINKADTQILAGYPSALYLFTLQLQKHNIKLPKIKVLKTASEMLLPQHRESIESWWKQPVLDWYGQAEMTVLTVQCPYGNYHNQDDYGICEVMEDNQLIVTSLNNDAMPFIRYRSGDIVEPLEAPNNTPCGCGRQFSIPFKKVIGRSGDFLVKTDGTKVPSVNFYSFLSKVAGIKQFKITQKADYSITMKVVPEESFNAHQKILESMQQRLGDLPIQLDLVNEIPRDQKTMKQKTVESHVS